MSPIRRETAKAVIVMPVSGNKIVLNVIFPNTKVPRHPTTMPKMPPMPQRTAASMRNCVIMPFRSAPMALRMPISLVRSLTVTNMIFIMRIKSRKTKKG